jgi:hypothetical protein
VVGFLKGVKLPFGERFKEGLKGEGILDRGILTNCGGNLRSSCYNK